MAFSRSLHATNRLKKRDDSYIPFDLEVGQEEIPPKRTEASEPTRRGTITPSERQVFERIFADIKARGLKPTLLDEDASPPLPPSDGTRHAMLIMQEAAKDAGQDRPAHVAAPGLLAGAARDRHKALLRFPPDLRAAASKALGAIQSSAAGYSEGDDIEYDSESLAAAHENLDEGWKAPAHSLGRTVELEAKRSPERTRIEGLMAAAKTDCDLWDVLEKEVFTMPTKLGLDTTASKAGETNSTTSPKMWKKRKNKRVLNVEVKDSEHVSMPAASDTVEGEAHIAAGESSTTPEKEKLSLYVHGPLYPAYLLLALRRFDTAFYAPSPLAFSVLPRIKELGLESYVLGVSTPFYNELLELYWTRRGDLMGMLDLLEEMRHCGLYFDDQTREILAQVVVKINNLAYQTSTGSFGRAIMMMPEYQKSIRARLNEWGKAVDASIRERQVDIGY